jgi:hypothetical protein
MFRLRRGGAVRVVVSRIGCVFVRAFSVHGHAGVNRIRFAGRIHGERLPRGTYRIRARSHGATVLRAKVVVVGGPYLSCERAITGIARLAGLSFAGGSSTRSKPTGVGTPSTESAKTAVGKLAAPSHGGVLGARAAQVLPSSGGTQVALLIVLACAILMLTLGAMPRGAVPHPAAAAFLARRRTLITAGGLAALGAFLVSYFVA